ncbi:MAG: WD40 repeat domain-containing protein [Sphingobacteriales bacterium]|nr:MAG: WD40 repeat domain-containing protein [Sphingobacteriales bacterium]
MHKKMQAIDLVGHNNPVYTIVTHPKLNLCYTAGNDKGIVEWDTLSQKFLRVFNPVLHTVYALQIVLPYNLLVAGCSNGHILFFDIESGLLQFTLEANAAVFCIKYLPQKHEILASTDAGEMIVISINEKKIVYRFATGTQKIRNFDFNLNLDILATASNDATVRLYLLADYSFVHQFEAHTLGVSAIAFSPDGKKLITASRDAHLKIWNTQNWLCLHTITAHLFTIYQISFHPQLPYFATCSRDKSIKIWRSIDYSLFKNLSIDNNINGHRLSVNHIYWQANGKSILSVSDDKLLKIWTLNLF